MQGLGASWLTTIFGGLTILSDVGSFASHFLATNPAPTTVQDWFVWGMGLVTGVGLIVAKSYNVSNSQRPAAAATVSPVAAATTNPAAEIKA